MELRPLLVIDVDVEPIVELGALPLGARRFVPFRGGTFEGRDGLRGTVGPGGVDWQVARPDGVLEIDAHYVLVTDTGDTIEVHAANRSEPASKLRHIAATLTQER